MSTYAFPTLSDSRLVNALVIGFLTNAKVAVSPLTGAIQRIARGGQRWHFQMTLSNLQGNDRALMQSFVAKLDGPLNDFTVYDHSYTRLGSVGGTPLVNAGSQTGSSLNIKGCSNNITDWLKEGDQFSFSNGTFVELKIMTAPADSDGSGLATLNFKPPIRIAPANNAAITTTNPTGQFIQMANETGWNNKLGGSIMSDFTFDVVEMIVAAS